MPHHTGANHVELDIDRTPGQMLSRLDHRVPHDLAVAVAVFGKSEQKLTIMTAMGQVIEFSRQEVAVGSGHAASIDAMTRLLQRKRGRKKSL